MKVGLALSGGGARGISHIGVLKALQEAHIPIHRLSGTSAGAIVGALFAAGHAPDAILQMITSTNLFWILRPALSRGGLLKLEALAEIMQKYLPDNTFEGLKLPLTVGATDFVQGTTRYFETGPLIRPILAACSIPVVFEPINIQGHMYVDGGLLDNLPTTPLEGRVDYIIGSHCNPIDGNFDIKNVKKVMERSLLMAINGNTQKSKEACHVLIEPPGLAQYSGFELKKAEAIFSLGYEEGKRMADNIYQQLQQPKTYEF
jgi:NTE family protein